MRISLRTVRCAKQKKRPKKKFTVQQHVGRQKHLRAMQLASKKKSTQRLLQETASMKDNKSSDFYKNLCEALVSANTPFSTLDNVKLKSFLELNFGRPIPDESSMLQLYQRMWKRFSPDTKVLSNNRRSLTFDNLRKLVVVYCNNAE